MTCQQWTERKKEWKSRNEATELTEMLNDVSQWEAAGAEENGGRPTEEPKLGADVASNHAAWLPESQISFAGGLPRSRLSYGRKWMIRFWFAEYLPS